MRMLPGIIAILLTVVAFIALLSFLLPAAFWFEVLGFIVLLAIIGLLVWISEAFVSLIKRLFL